MCVTSYSLYIGVCTMLKVQIQLALTLYALCRCLVLTLCTRSSGCGKRWAPIIIWSMMGYLDR